MNDCMRKTLIVISAGLIISAVIFCYHGGDLGEQMLKKVQLNNEKEMPIQESRDVIEGICCQFLLVLNI